MARESDDDARRRHKKHKKKEKRSSSKDAKRSRRHRSSSSESSDDERARRKQRKRAEKMLASFGYSNDTNPFGDSNLSQPFVWGKKYEDGEKKKSSKPSEKELKQAQLERMEEIRKARKRREEREAEREEMERLKNEELRLRDAEQYEDWQQKEEEFHLNQARVRSKLRIKEKRERPVDLLAKNLLLVAHTMQQDEKDDFLSGGGHDGVRVETRRPHAIVEVLSMDELLELQDNITEYLDLEESDGENKEFWTLMMLICRDRIRRLRRSQSEHGTERGAIHDSVNDTITDMLQGKDKAELLSLKKDVTKTIASAETSAGVDVEFWEEVSQQIEVYVARARLTELHEDMLGKLHDLIEKYDAAAAAGEHHQQRDSGRVGDRDESREAMQMERAEAHKELEDMEEKMGMSEEVAIDDVPQWSEKYQPRKPRYFNRVKTGYDWNKYNQTHYDHDNPPPKVVQGYKFNLFYPDLIDKHAAPRFFLEKTNSPDFCIIRFSAGPPYQDIAFKIVNREWEYSHKRGFKSVFERGILHLYFNFKRHRYRR
uniref:Splicing factor Cactin n=1 Tax=Globisporangium ultimum (strain ATCC 200006 / CBS 805.95 / DAOM BR144) TaxID=431595 RepID=K3X2U2_GLOUD